jgi:hypothetical protein
MPMRSARIHMAKRRQCNNPTNEVVEAPGMVYLIYHWTIPVDTLLPNSKES